MKRFFYSALAALALASTTQGATLYSSNLGNGITEVGGISAFTTGTVRFGVFPSDFNFSANSENYTALNNAFTEVASYSGPISVNSTTGFFDLTLSYNASGTFEGVPYDSSAGSTTNASGDIAGEKVYVWILNNTAPSTATQQAIFSTRQTWADADELAPDTFVSPDTGALELVAHLGGLANGNNIGAGAPSHSASGALIVPSGVQVTVNPSTPQVPVSTRVVFTVTNASGTPPITYQWRRNGQNILGATGTTYVITSASLSSRANYDCVLRNGTNTDVASNSVFLNVVTPRPTIITAPQSQIVGTGESVGFTVQAVATGTLNYSWRKGSTVLSTSDALNLSNVSLADAGAISVTASNTPGANTGSASSTANLVVVNQSPVSFVAQARTPATTTATLQVTTAGTGITGYRWFLLPDLVNPLEDGSKYSGAGTARLTIRSLNLDDAGDYVCRVSAYGSSKDSGAINLTVYNSPPALGTVTLPTGIVGGFYTYTIPQNLLPNGTNVAESFTASPLPAGLTLNAKTGVISGFPTAATTATTRRVRITAVNKSGTSTAVEVPIVINAFPANLAGIYEGPINRGAVPSGDLGGRYDMTVTPTGTLTGKLTLGTTVLSFSDRLTITGTDPATAIATGNFAVRRVSGAPYQVSFRISNNLVVGIDDNNAATEDFPTISLGVASQTFEAWRSTWVARTSPATQYAHRYNVALGLLPGHTLAGDAAVAPQGVGFFSFTVAADGKLTFDGNLPDGERITGPAFLGPNGELFIFRTYYTTAQKGSLLAIFDISRSTSLNNASDNTVAGKASWNRPANNAASNRLYRSGFNIPDADVKGGAYSLPLSGFPLDLAANETASLQFDQANVNASGRNNPNAVVTFAAPTRFTITTRSSAAARTTLTPLTPATGVFKGTFVSQGTRTVPFSGLIVPIDGVPEGVGYFLLDQAGTPATQQSGVVALEKVRP